MSTAAWNTYVAVDDADAAAETVAGAGGQVTMRRRTPGPAADGRVPRPDGAAFRSGSGAASRRPGRERAGSWNFSDLHTSDAARGKGVLRRRCSVGRPTSSTWGGATMWRRPGYGDHLAATVDPGIHERQAGHRSAARVRRHGRVVGTPAGDEAPHWHVTFAVADRDGAVATAVRLGATVVWPARHEWTEAVVLRDPQGAVITLSQFDPQG